MTTKDQAIADFERTLAEVEALERQIEQEAELSEQLDQVEASEATPAPTAQAGGESPAIRDTRTLLDRLSRSADNSRRLAKTAQELAFTVARFDSRRGEGPAYLAVAVKALREETRACEVALRLAQLMVDNQNYGMHAIRDASWAKDEE
jgi:hypothetical protein